MCVNNILKKSIKHVQGLSKKKVHLLNSELNIYTYEDFLLFYPKTYIYTPIKNISELEQKKNQNCIVQIIGTIEKIREISYQNKPGKIMVVSFKDDTGSIELIWFYKYHFLRILKKNYKYLVSGRTNFFQEKIQIIHPNIKELRICKNILFIHPIYRISKKLEENGINNSMIINVLSNIIKEFKKNSIEDFFFQEFLKKKIMPRNQALVQIHFPKSFQDLFKAKYSLKFEEIFLIKLFFLYEKKKICSKPIYKFGKKFYHFYKYFLPFNLTHDQKKAFKEILNDLKKPIQMNRLLQGEVGSGKTIVAMLSMLIALDNGFQSCFMVPTEILAIQHYHYVKKMFSKIDVKIALLTSSISKPLKKQIYHNIVKGTVNIVIGTHALIQKKVSFHNLGLAIIDEQHRFGVEQRKKICNHYRYPPHVLIMSATPIPRTLAQVLYKNLYISILKKIPDGRKPVRTIHILNEKRDQAWKIIEQQILIGRQIYIVYPTINRSKKNKYHHLMNGYKKIKERFKDVEVGILHGSMKENEKEMQMHQFCNGNTKIINTTTIIEVGIDIPNATVILIENANCFGLSQLHQMRGRVGRGKSQSYCILMTDKNMSEEGFLRITKMCNTNNGLKIAKEDLKLRGSGDLIGIKQSGKHYLRITNFCKDYKFIKKVIQIAENFSKKNPNFFNDKSNFHYQKKIKNLFIT
ncbi:ATP-dependent DNA helicase RecG [Blattabacterium cuenoti]|uniref:ATP-dependent DNA helicase RecG n=1 Tax=Blattabacterium cuenoti TaxID=1653831 RepID=UPI00163B7961|nr:ATP-dependent DNA helicase RecG [Blattabacterium cuenoti]